MKKVKIETGIPIPPIKRRAEHYPFGTMRVDESFVYEGTKISLNKLLSRKRNEYKKKKFVSRSVSKNKYRVWRTK